jgi:HPt (histidine-containing phosphotransfer) domain-containing protein
MEQPNLTYINELSGGDETFKNKLITVIKKEFPEEKAVYYQNLKSRNLKIAAENVHKLKHKISILGLEKSYGIAEAFEENLIENNVSGFETFNAILQNITDYLQTL